MQKFHSFRPTLAFLEDRSMMSATMPAPMPELLGNPAPAAQTREHILLARQVGVPSVTPETGYTITLSDVLVSSAQPATQTREHILLARQVGVPAVTEGAGFHRLFGDVNGDK